ncbi:MAG: DUF262 domain-containing protein [Sedimentibacter sp.]
MALLFHRNTKTVKEVFDDFSKGRLFVDTTYQRRKVWLPQDKIRLIETILLDLIIPEVFFWPADINAETGDMFMHIVDGQQRINSIVEFISGEFQLDSKYLMDKDIIERCSNKYFADLGNADKERIWKYNISVVNIDSSFTKTDITQMFYRLNLTNYSLNPQEKRNSKESVFGDAAEALSSLDFWKECRVFSSADAKRMKDIEYCCSIYILANEGVVDQTNSKKINDYYDDYSETFDEDKRLTNKIETAMDMIKSLNDKTTLSFVSKKAQMYTLFSFVFKLIDSGLQCSNEVFERFKLFVSAYNRFRNEFDIDFRNVNMRKTNEDIKKYKLASSEGINKIGNRVIRLQTLYSICIESSPDIKGRLKELENIYNQQNKPGDVIFEAFDTEDLSDINEAE